MSQPEPHRRPPRIVLVQQLDEEPDPAERESIEALIARFLELVRNIEDRKE